jgi:hypothetical protein
LQDTKAQMVEMGQYLPRRHFLATSGSPLIANM